MAVGASTKKKRVRPELAAPVGLAAARLAAGVDELVLFTWPGSRDSDPSGVTLSRAEREVLAGVVRGASNREIARARFVSERTVANQVASVLRKVGARSRYELIRRFAET
ncbi:MAG: helix-turn-helix transcriptional regulator [Labilithrix sp.]|nr:helix-turn-helix transcriptional regulator [Labilithrix sp.]MCW5817802.1 helix-turn-helix transcriptional regulator [Labilithrix sp.]